MAVTVRHAPSLAMLSPILISEKIFGFSTSSVKRFLRLLSDLTWAVISTIPVNIIL